MFENTKNEYEKLVEERRIAQNIEEQKETLRENFKNKNENFNEFHQKNDLLYKELEKQNKIIKYQENNYRYTLAQEAKPVLQKVFDKYVGKRIGDKTRQKIRDEFREYGLIVSWICRYSNMCEIYIRHSVSNYLSIELHLNVKMYSDDGKLIQINFNSATCYQGKEYISNAEERIVVMERIEKEIKQKEKELSDLIHSHSDLCVAGMKIFFTTRIGTTEK